MKPQEQNKPKSTYQNQPADSMGKPKQPVDVRAGAATDKNRKDMENGKSAGKDKDDAAYSTK